MGWNLPGDVVPVAEFTWTGHPSEVLIMGGVYQRMRLTCGQGLAVGGTHGWLMVGIFRDNLSDECRTSLSRWIL